MTRDHLLGFPALATFIADQHAPNRKPMRTPARPYVGSFTQTLRAADDKKATQALKAPVTITSAGIKEIHIVGRVYKVRLTTPTGMRLDVYSKWLGVGGWSAYAHYPEWVRTMPNPGWANEPKAETEVLELMPA